MIGVVAGFSAPKEKKNMLIFSNSLTTSHTAYVPPIHPHSPTFDKCVFQTRQDIQAIHCAKFSLSKQIVYYYKACNLLVFKVSGAGNFYKNGLRKQRKGWVRTYVICQYICIYGDGCVGKKVSAAKENRLFEGFYWAWKP